MKNRTGRERVAVFILRIQGATAKSRRVSFHLVNRQTGELAKQSDAARFGFFVEPQYALRVLKLVGAQAEADNEKLTIEELRTHFELETKTASFGGGLI